MDTHRVKIGDDLVEEAQALNATVVDALLRVEVGKIGQGGKHHSNLIVRLAVQLLERQDQSAQTAQILRYGNVTFHTHQGARSLSQL